MYKRRKVDKNSGGSVSISETSTSVTYFAKDTNEDYSDACYAITIFKNSSKLFNSASQDLEISNPFFVNKHVQFCEKTGRNDTETFVVTDYVQCGDLQTFLKYNRTILCQELIIDWAIQLLMGAYSLEMNDLVYSDITPRTLGLTENGSQIRYIDYDNVREVKTSKFTRSLDRSGHFNLHFTSPE